MKTIETLSGKRVRLAEEEPDECVVVSCAGCRLLNLEDARRFVYEDLGGYERTEFRRIPGKSPEMLFLKVRP